MSIGSQQLGADAAYEALRARQSLVPLLEAAMGARRTQEGAALYSGLLGVISHMLSACRAGGLRFEIANRDARQIAEALPHARSLLLLAKCQADTQESRAILVALAEALYAARDKFEVGPDRPRAERANEQPVMQVEIVGMPQRLAQHTVTRTDGQISGSLVLEQDA